ncbi:MAG: hypothetical protein AB1650_06605 [Candidatus Omnitrophota bacterium]
MENLFPILMALPRILFWSAVLSFVPVTYYLLIKNPPILKAERMRDMGIFVIGQDVVTRKREAVRTKTLAVIYGLCAVFLSVVYFLNILQNKTGVAPFDVLSTVSVILFAFSLVTYLPFAMYLALKNPWKNREEGACLTCIFMGYGAALLVFSVIFAFRWLQRYQMQVGIDEIVISVFAVFFSSLAIAYLPICFYIFRKIANPYRPKQLHPNVIFVIYSVCFLLFSSIFIVNWISNRRLGIYPESISSFF